MHGNLTNNLTRILALEICSKHPNVDFKDAYAQMAKLVGCFDIESNVDTRLVSANLQEAEALIDQSRRDLAAAESLYANAFRAWSLYVTNKAVELVVKAHSAILNHAEAEDIGHKYTEWIFQIMEEGIVTHISNILVAATEISVPKNEIRTRRRKIRILNAYLAGTDQPHLRATPHDVDGYLQNMKKISDFFTDQMQSAITVEEFEKLITGLIDEYQSSPSEPGTTNRHDIWLDKNPKQLLRYYVDQYFVYIRLVFLGLLLEPHDNPSRYFNPSNKAPSPKDYDAVHDSPEQMLGIVAHLPDIWRTIEDAIKTTGEMINHQRTVLLN